MWCEDEAITHSLFAVYTGNGEIPAVGASGAISGVLGAYLIMYPKAKIYTIVIAFFITTIRIPAIAFIPFWFIMQIVLNFINPLGGVAYMAHIGGFVAGLGTGYLWKTLRFQNPISFQPKWQTIKNRPNMVEMGIGTAPEIIKGTVFFVIIVAVRGLSGILDS